MNLIYLQLKCKQDVVLAHKIYTIFKYSIFFQIWFSSKVQFLKSTPIAPKMNKWSGISRLLEHQSPFANETGKLGIGEFQPGKDVLKSLQSSDTKVLVVGAGGLGCEVRRSSSISISNINDYLYPTIPYYYHNILLYRF